MCIICGTPQYRIKHRQNKYTLAECLGCGLHYIEPIPSLKQLEIFYDESYSDFDPNTSMEQLEKKDKIKHWQQDLKYIEKFRSRWNILDVGCGAGIFLNTARKAGWNCTGVEMNSRYVFYAKKQLRLNVFDGGLADANFNNSTFDVITLWHVLEHLSNPLETLAIIRRVLKDNGVLVVCVPNINSFSARVWGKHWHWLQIPVHLFHFSPHTLNLLMEKAGFEPTKVRTRTGRGSNIFMLSLGRFLLYYLAHFRDTVLVKSAKNSASSKSEGSALTSLMKKIEKAATAVSELGHHSIGIFLEPILAKMRTGEEIVAYYRKS